MMHALAAIISSSSTYGAVREMAAATVINLGFFLILRETGRPLGTRLARAIEAIGFGLLGWWGEIRIRSRRQVHRALAKGQNESFRSIDDNSSNLSVFTIAPSVHFAKVCHGVFNCRGLQHAIRCQ